MSERLILIKEVIAGFTYGRVRVPGPSWRATMKPKIWRFRLQIYIAGLFLVLVLGFSLTNLALDYIKFKEVLLNSADKKFHSIESAVSSSIEDRYTFAVFAMNTLSNSMLTQAQTLEDRLKFVPMLCQILRDRPKIASVYIGYDSGDFFRVGRLGQGLAVGNNVEPPAAAAFFVQSVERRGAGTPSTQYRFLDTDLNGIGDQTVPGGLEPRARGWFTQAMNSGEAIITAPYVFASTGEMGATIAHRSIARRTVVAADLPLATLSRHLRTLRPTPGSELAIIDSPGQVLAASDLSDAELTAASTSQKQHFVERHRATRRSHRGCPSCWGTSCVFERYR